MARYKPVDTTPRLLPVILEHQLPAGTFEHALNHLINHEMPDELAAFDRHYRNDKTGAPAYAPAMLLKVILFAYSRGLVSSRDIERACREHVTFIALSGDSQPHFTTIAAFIRQLGADIARLFARILWLCDRQGLIGRQMFAIDGIKLPSNAAKHRSGTRADFERQAQKLETAVTAMMERHRNEDAEGEEADSRRRRHERNKTERLQKEAAALRQWLADHPADKTGSRGSIRKSNRTDNDSAKMATDKGVLQGYTGIAAVDDKHQVIVEAEAWGSGSEQGVVVPVAERLREKALLTADSVITADSGFHSKENLKQLAERNIRALIADRELRLRDERQQGRERHKPAKPVLHRKRSAEEFDAPAAKPGLYKPTDFDFDPVRETCICPNGQKLRPDGRECVINGYRAIKFRGVAEQCCACLKRHLCLRKPEYSLFRQVAFFRGKAEGEVCPVERMRALIDSPAGRALYDRRLGTVEPVFGNLRYNKGLDRFTLRGQKKVDTQWQLYCLVHNIEKLARYGNLVG